MDSTDLVALVDALRRGEESEHIEYKRASNDFDSDKALDYCAALANEGGGRLLLGIENKSPHPVSGSAAFSGGLLNDIKKRLRQTFPTITVKVDEVAHPSGRVVMFTVPSHPPGEPVLADGRAWMRYGEELLPMTGAKLRDIVLSGLPDFSATICRAARLLDLDPIAIQMLRALRDAVKPVSGRPKSDRSLLQDLHLIVGANVTYAALVLLGKADALARLLPNSEIIYEYRVDPSAVDWDDRLQRTQGYLSFHDELWERVDQHNGAIHAQSGAFRTRAGKAFEKRVVREAILNAVSHRNYAFPSSIFIRHTPSRLVIQSPGGLPPPVTLVNILDRSEPRNRLITDVLQAVDLVQRSGQGINVMFEDSIKAGKGRPDFDGTDDHQVQVSLPGEVEDPSFVAFIREADRRHQLGEDERTKDLLVLDLVRSQADVPAHLAPRLRALATAGLVQVKKPGRRPEYILPRAYWDLVERPGAHTSQVGLDRDYKKALLLKHIVSRRGVGAPIAELEQVLPSDSRRYVQRLAAELKDDQKVFLDGRGPAARWHPTP